MRFILELVGKGGELRRLAEAMGKRLRKEPIGQPRVAR
jgi:hypothetical protein